MNRKTKNVISIVEMPNRSLLIFLFGIIILSTVTSAYGDPSATFCEDSGNEYVNKIQKDGSEKGYCDVNGNLIDAWEYYLESEEEKRSTKNASTLNNEEISENIQLTKKDKAKKLIKTKLKRLVTSLIPASIDQKIKDRRERLISAKSQDTHDISLGISATNANDYSEFDWRNKDGQNWLTPVKNQDDNHGHSWAFASVGAFESKININLKNATLDKDLSEQYIMDNIEKLTTDNVMEYVKGTGVLEESCNDYENCKIGASARSKIGDYVGISSPSGSCDPPSIGCTTSSNMTAIKQAIVEHGPITAGIYTCDDFITYTGGVYENNCSSTDLKSGVSVVGYNDSGQYWIIRNSWGESWGEKGYARIAYSQSMYNLSDYLKNGCTASNCSKILYLGSSYYITTTDADSDEIVDGIDNCPFVTNKNQKDENKDNVGDACDDDIDGDGILNGQDNCPFVANTNQEDEDNVGDACTLIEFDWRNKDGQNWLTPVKNQDDNHGHSWAFASVGAFESKIKINTGNSIFNKDLSEQDVINNPKEYYKSHQWALGPRHAFPFMDFTGVVTEDCIPYGDNNLCDKASPERSKISSYEWIGLSNIVEIKSAIINHGPIVAGMVPDEDFRVYSGGVYQSTSPRSNYNHSDPSSYQYVLVVGYNDSGQYWIIRNSWGEDWGEEGYAKIDYSQVSNDMLSNPNSLWENKSLTFYHSYYITTTDADADGLLDDTDNCPFVANSNQEDTNGDGVGDVCECDLNWDSVISSCQSDNMTIITYNITNGCGIGTNMSSNGSQISCNPCTANDTAMIDEQDVYCDYCTPNVVNSSWTKWKDTGNCRQDDTISQSRNRTEYDADYTNCYAFTRLESDFWNSGNNITHVDNRNTACDYDEDGYVGNLSDVSTSLKLDLITDNITFKVSEDDNDTLLEFNFNLSKAFINFKNLTIERQPNNSDKSFLIVGGLDLASQNETKTVYIDAILGSTSVCIKDSEMSNISEFSLDCNGTDEYFLICPGAKHGYSCSLVNGTKYKVTGLSHSGVLATKIFCGDGKVNGDETCSTCAADVGACPSTGGSTGGSGKRSNTGGGKGGGNNKRNAVIVVNETTNITNETVKQPNDIAGERGIMDTIQDEIDIFISTIQNTIQNTFFSCSEKIQVLQYVF